MTKIVIKQSDITKETTDAIVNAAHPMLMGGGGVDGAIHRAAGPKLIQACQGIPLKEVGKMGMIRCDYGEAYITPAFNLPSKYVIHTVAPVFVGHKTKTGEYVAKDQSVFQILDDCYANCFNIADDNEIKSISFPSLGTGGHAFPIEEASKIAIRTMLRFLPKLTKMELIQFICFSDYDLTVYNNHYAQMRAEYDQKLTVEKNEEMEKESLRNSSIYIHNIAKTRKDYQFVGVGKDKVIVYVEKDTEEIHQYIDKLIKENMPHLKFEIKVMGNISPL